MLNLFMVLSIYLLSLLHASSRFNFLSVNTMFAYGIYLNNFVCLPLCKYNTYLLLSNRSSASLPVTTSFDFLVWVGCVGRY